MDKAVQVSMSVNSEAVNRTVEPRQSLADFIRNELELTGTHVGCEHGICGACTILVNGKAVRSCLMLAMQADGLEIDTIEGLAEKIIELTGSNSSITYIPYEEAYSEGFEDMMRRVPDCSKIEQYIGWKPKINLDETIEQVDQKKKIIYLKNISQYLE